LVCHLEAALGTAEISSNEWKQSLHLGRNQLIVIRLHTTCLVGIPKIQQGFIKKKINVRIQIYSKINDKRNTT